MLSRNRIKLLVASLAAMSALVAVGVSSAAAEVVPANFSGSTIKLTTTGVTIKKSGAEAKTCTFSPSAPVGLITEGFAQPMNNTSTGTSNFSCTGSTKLESILWFEATYDTVTGQYKLYCVGDFAERQSPYGLWAESAFNGSWNNGSGTTQSTVTYNETQIGQTSTRAPITMTGTFTVTTSTGGLLTLSH